MLCSRALWLLSSEPQKHKDANYAANTNQVLTDSLKELFNINRVLCTCLNHDSTNGLRVLPGILQGHLPGKEGRPAEVSAHLYRINNLAEQTNSSRANSSLVGLQNNNSVTQ